MYYPVSALVTLFTHILQNPLDPQTRTDLSLMQNVCEFLLAIREEDEAGSITRMLAICKEFDRIARVVLDKAEREAQTRRKRKQVDKDEESGPKTSLPVGITMAKDADPNFFNRSASVGPVTRSPGDATVSPTSPLSFLSSPPASTNTSLQQQHNYQQQQQQLQQQQQQLQQQQQQQQLTRQARHNTPMSGFDPFSPSTNLSWLGDIPSPAPPPQTPKFTFTTAGTGVSPMPDGDGGVFVNGGLYGSISSPSPSMANFAEGAGSYQAPFIQQELWPMPMPVTMEWDWADLGGATWSMGGDDAT